MSDYRNKLAALAFDEPTGFAISLKNPWRDKEGEFSTESDDADGRPDSDPAEKVVGSGTGRTVMRAADKKADAERIKALRIPPAWTDVHLSENPKAALQAMGTDAKGRTQYLYSAEHSAKASAEKFERLKSFHSELPKLREAVLKDLERGSSATPEEREAAAIVYLIDKTAFRIGSDSDTGADKKAYGASTLKSNHVKIDGDKVAFRFTGKKGVSISKTIHDAKLASILRPRVEKGGRLFDVSPNVVRDYLHSRDGDHMVKDFRTWHGTNEALKAMKSMPKPKTATAFKKAQREVLKKVSRHLGNTPAVAKASYIDPSVWGQWQIDK